MPANPSEPRQDRLTLSKARRSANFLGRQLATRARGAVYGVRDAVLRAVNHVISGLKDRLSAAVDAFQSGMWTARYFVLRFTAELRAGLMAVKAIALASIEGAYNNTLNDAKQQIAYFKGYIDRIGNQVLRELRARSPLETDRIDWNAVRTDRALMARLAEIKQRDPALYQALRGDPKALLTLGQPSKMHVLVIGLLTGRHVTGKYELGANQFRLSSVIGQQQTQKNARAGRMYGDSLYSAFWGAARQAITELTELHDTPDDDADARTVAMPDDPGIPDAAPDAAVVDPMDLDDPLADESLAVADSPFDAAEADETEAVSDDSANESDTEPSDDDSNAWEEMRVLTGDERSCAGCRAAAGHWAPIGTLPPLNTLECGNNCRCEFVFQRADQQQQQPALASRGARVELAQGSNVDTRMARMSQVFELVDPQSTQLVEARAYGLLPAPSQDDAEPEEFEPTQDDDDDAPQLAEAAAQATDETPATILADDTFSDDEVADLIEDQIPGTDIVDVNDMDDSPEAFDSEDQPSVDEDSDPDHSEISSEPDAELDSELLASGEFEEVDGGDDDSRTSFEPVRTNQSSGTKERSNDAVESSSLGARDEAQGNSRAEAMDQAVAIENEDEQKYGDATETAQQEGTDAVNQESEATDDLVEVGAGGSEERGDEEIIGNVTNPNDGVAETAMGSGDEFVSDVTADGVVDTVNETGSWNEDGFEEILYRSDANGEPSV